MANKFFYTNNTYDPQLEMERQRMLQEMEYMKSRDEFLGRSLNEAVQAQKQQHVKVATSNQKLLLLL